MVDNVNPTSQFHPYQPQTAVPQTGSRKSGLTALLNRFGISQSKTNALGTNMRQYARNNSGIVLGSLAALVIGAGLIRRRSHARF